MSAPLPIDVDGVFDHVGAPSELRRSIAWWDRANRRRARISWALRLGSIVPLVASLATLYFAMFHMEDLTGFVMAGFLVAWMVFLNRLATRIGHTSAPGVESTFEDVDAAVRALALSEGADVRVRVGHTDPLVQLTLRGGSTVVATRKLNVRGRQYSLSDEFRIRPPHDRAYLIEDAPAALRGPHIDVETTGDALIVRTAVDAPIEEWWPKVIVDAERALGGDDVRASSTPAPVQTPPLDRPPGTLRYGPIVVLAVGALLAWGGAATLSGHRDVEVSAGILGVGLATVVYAIGRFVAEWRGWLD